MNNDALWQMELPRAQVPDIANWSENYACDAYDPIRRICIYLHIGRWYLDPELWTEVVPVCIDGKEVYSRRNIGQLDDAAIVGAGCLRQTCEEPMQRWCWRYRGPVLASTADELLRQPPLDALAHRLDFDLNWQAAGAMVDFGHGTEPGADATHYEQGGTLKGSLAIDGREIPFDGRSFRDHSCGPRVLGRNFNRHLWTHGVFPSGRTISSLLVEIPGGRIGLDALLAVEKNGSIHRYRFRMPVLRDSWDDITRAYVMEGIDDAGRSLRIEAEPQFFFPLTLAPPMDLFVGQSNAFDGWRVFQMPTRLRWDGEETWGHTEFTLTIPKSRSYPFP